MLKLFDISEQKFTTGKLFDGFIVVGDILIGGFLGRIIGALWSPENGPPPVNIPGTVWVTLYAAAAIAYLIALGCFWEPIKYAARTFTKAGDMFALFMLACIGGLGIAGLIGAPLFSLDMMSLIGPWGCSLLVFLAYAIFFYRNWHICRSFFQQSGITFFY